MALDLTKYAEDFREGMLKDKPSAWMCRAVCLPLLTLLTMQGIAVEITEGTVICDGYEIEHTWLTLPDGLILDPTADQFNDHISEWDMPPVFHGEKPLCYLRMDE